MDRPDQLPFALTSAAHPDALVLHVSGTLDFLNAPLFRSEVDGALRAPGAATLIIDLSAVAMCDSSGLTELLRALKQSKAADVHLMLAGVRANLEQRLIITGLAAVFDSRPSLDEALRHTRPPGHNRP